MASVGNMQGLQIFVLKCRENHKGEWHIQDDL